MFRLCLLTCLILGAASQSATFYMCGDSVADISAGQSFIVRSYNYGNGGRYMDNQDCSLQIRTSYEPLVLSLRYNAFSVEYASNCNYDALCMNGVEFCGGWLGASTFSYIVPAYKTFTLRFHSDVSVTETGFDVTVSAQTAYNATVNETVSGVGSRSENVNSALNSYSPLDDQYYTDRCGSTQFYNNVTTPYPYYNSTSYYPSNYSTITGYPNYNTTSFYPYYNSTGYPYYHNTTGYYPNYTTSYYPYYNTTTPSNGTYEAQSLIRDAINLLQRALSILQYGY